MMAARRAVAARLAVRAAVLLLAASARPVAAQDVRVAMEVDTTLIHVGDPVAVRLHVDHPADWAVQWPDSLDLAPFEVLRYEVAEPGAGGAGSGADEAARSTASLIVTSFELGELELPVISLAVAAPNGTVRTLFTDPFRIGVESVGLDESGDIRDIRGPLSIARNWWTLLPWLLLFVAAGAGAVYLHRRRRARSVAAESRPAAPPRPFHLAALEALEELEQSALLERGQVKRYHVRISEIIRSYVEGQLEVPALEMTTGEVVDGLRNAALGDRITGSFGTFLGRCDLVKFAKLRPGVKDSRELMGTARSLVGMTSGGGVPAGSSASRRGPRPEPAFGVDAGALAAEQGGPSPAPAEAAEGGPP